MIIPNLFSQLPPRSQKHRKRLYLPNNGVWWLLFVGCYSTEVLMQAAGVARRRRMCVRTWNRTASTCSADTWQGSSQRHTICANNATDQQPYNLLTYSFALYSRLCDWFLARAILHVTVSYIGANHICVRSTEAALRRASCGPVCRMLAE